VSCAQRRDDVLLLAAGLLEEPEAAALRAHLAAGCRACAAHLAEARAVEAALALAGADGAPSPDLRAELRRRAAGADGAGAPALGERRGRSARIGRFALAAGLAAAAAAPLGWLAAGLRHGAVLDAQATAVAELRERSAGLEAELAEAREEQEEIDAELGELEARSRGVESDLKRAERQVAMLSHPGLVTLDLVGTTQPDARARVFWEWDDYYCYLRAEGLRAVEPPAVYALWLDTESGGRILAGTFAPPADGPTTLWVQLPRDMGKAVAAAITLEPEAPGPSPAGPVQLRSASAGRS
jgi:hypothetical protein